MIEEIMDWVLGVLLVLSLAALVALLGGGIYAWMNYEDAVKVVLIEDEWTCTKSHQTMFTTTVIVGKVLVPVTNQVTTCDQWERKS